MTECVLAVSSRRVVAVSESLVTCFSPVVFWCRFYQQFLLALCRPDLLRFSTINSEVTPSIWVEPFGDKTNVHEWVHLDLTSSVAQMPF